MARERIGRIQIDGCLELCLRLLALIEVRVGHAEVEVRVWILGVELDGFLVLLDGHLMGVGGKEARQVVVRSRALRLQLERGQVLLERLREELLLRVDGREVVVGMGRLGVELDRFLEFLDRLVQPAAVGQLDSARVVLVGADRLVLPLRVAAHASSDNTKGRLGLPPETPFANASLQRLSRRWRRCTCRNS